MPHPDTVRTLYRSKKNHLVGGVCSGVAEYFSIDPNWIRYFVLATFLFFPISILCLYILSWSLFPKGEQTHPKESNAIKALPQLLAQLSHQNELISQPTLQLESPLPHPESTVHNNTTPQEEPPLVHDKDLTDFPNTYSHHQESQDADHAASLDNLSDDYLTALNEKPYNDKKIMNKNNNDFPDEFLQSFNADNMTAPKTNTLADNDFPDDFLQSFNDENTTSIDKIMPFNEGDFAENSSNPFMEETKPLNNDFPDDFLNDVSLSTPTDFPSEFSQWDDITDNTQTTIDTNNSTDDFPAEFLQSLKDGDTHIEDL